LFRKFLLSNLKMKASSSAETLIHVYHNTRLHISNGNNSHKNVLIYNNFTCQDFGPGLCKPTFSRAVLPIQGSAEHRQGFCEKSGNK